MAILVMFLCDDDGEPIHKSERRWHLQHPTDANDDHLLCTGEFYGEGCSSVKYRVKLASIKKITCPECKKIVERIQHLT